MDRLLSTGHDVTWLSGAAYADRAARLGVRHVPLDRWTDLSSFDDPFDAFPHLRGLRGAKLIRTAFVTCSSPRRPASCTTSRRRSRTSRPT